MKEKKYIKTTIRVERDLWVEFRKWLIDSEYKSFNQFVVECVKKALGGKK